MTRQYPQPPRGPEAIPSTDGERLPQRALAGVSRAVRWMLEGRRILLTFALFWALEIFLVQDATLRPGAPQDWGGASFFWAQLGRYSINLFFALAVVSLVPRRLLFVPFLLWQIWAATAIGYHNYFDRPLGVQTAKRSFSEGAAVAGMGLDLVGGTTLTLLVIAFLLKCVFVLPAKRRVGFAWRTGLVMIVAWVGMAGIVNMGHPLHKMRRTYNFERTGMAYGYFFTWIGEEHFLGSRLLERAVETAEKKRSNRLADETPLPASDHVIIVQVESLEDSVVDLKVGGEYVMPFLEGLRHGSQYYKVVPFHDHGSADADFSMLTGRAPSPDLITYRLLDYPYGETLPKIFERAGYRAQMLHGLYGDFFDRRYAYEGFMGFSDLLFEEELESEHGLQSGKWGIKDRDVFGVGNDLIDARDGKVFQFIISLTSHGPFHFLTPEEEELFTKPSDLRERYLNHMRYVDRVLQAYFERLPNDSLVIFYGDHESATVPLERDANNRKIEFVPYIIHHKGHERRAKDPVFARSGELHQLDLVTYIRNHALRLAEARAEHAATH